MRMLAFLWVRIIQYTQECPVLDIHETCLRQQLNSQALHLCVCMELLSLFCTCVFVWSNCLYSAPVCLYGVTVFILHLCVCMELLSLFCTCVFVWSNCLYSAPVCLYAVTVFILHLCVCMELLSLFCTCVFVWSNCLYSEPVCLYGVTVFILWCFVGIRYTT